MSLRIRISIWRNLLEIHNVHPHFSSDGGCDVSGMPDPYMEHYEQGGQEMNPENKPQISFDESLESGYSTPNSRNRRIIREIIV